MIDACVPAEGSEDGSLHWVKDERGKITVSLWRKNCWWDWLNGMIGAWTYIAPASPDDAAALAAARAEAERLRDYIDAQRADNERLRVDLYGARAEGEKLKTIVSNRNRDISTYQGTIDRIVEYRRDIATLRAQVAALEAEIAAVRADAERFRWLLENQSYANRYSEDHILVETHIIEWASLMLPIGSDIRAAIDEDRAALTQSSGEGVGDE